MFPLLILDGLFDIMLRLYICFYNYFFLKCLIVCVIIYFEFHLNKNSKNISYITHISQGELL